MCIRVSWEIRIFVAENVKYEHNMDKGNASWEPKKATLAIINYELASIELVSLNSSLLDEYADDFDRLVYGAMGYKPESVYYMIADNIALIDNR